MLTVHRPRRPPPLSIRLTIADVSGEPAAHPPVSTAFAYEPCISAAPLIELDPPHLDLQSRSSAGANVRIANRDRHCVPTDWTFEFSSVDPSLHVNLLPETVTLASGQNGTALVLFSAPTQLSVMYAVTNITVSERPFAVGQSRRRTASRQLSVSFHQTECQRQKPAATLQCTPYIVGVQYDSSVKCTVTVVNHDSWPCQRRLFDLDMALAPNSADGWNGTRVIRWTNHTSPALRNIFPGSVVQVPPGYYGSTSATIWIPIKYMLEFNRTTVRTVLPSVRVSPRRPSPSNKDNDITATDELAVAFQPFVINASRPLVLGQCDHQAPSLRLVTGPPAHPLSLDGSALIQYAARNRNGMFCKPRARGYVPLLRVVQIQTADGSPVPPPPPPPPPIGGSGSGSSGYWFYEPSSLGLSGIPAVPPLDQFAAQESLISWQLRANYAGVYNATLRLLDPSNRTLASPSVSILVEVTPLCRVEVADLTVQSPFANYTASGPSSSSSLIAGKRRTVAFGLTLKNVDAAVSSHFASSGKNVSAATGCPSDEFILQVDTGPLPNLNPYYYPVRVAPERRGWHFEFSQNHVPSLAPGESMTTSLTVTLDNDVAPNDYVFRILARGLQAKHMTDTLVQLPLRCHAPEPVTRLRTTQVTAPFKLERNVRLVWENPCPDQFACCCPCEYVVRRNGALLATLTTDHLATRNFTDIGARSGDQFVYTVAVRDRTGRESPEAATCSGSVQVRVGDADRTLFYLFLAAVLLCAAVFGGAWVWAFRRAVRRRRQGYKDAQRRLRRNVLFDGIERADEDGPSVFTRIKVVHDDHDYHPDDQRSGSPGPSMSFAAYNFVHQLAGHRMLDGNIHPLHAVDPVPLDESSSSSEDYYDEECEYDDSFASEVEEVEEAVETEKLIDL